MRTITVGLLILLAAGSASTDLLADYSRAPEQTPKAADMHYDPPFDLVLLLTEAQADGQYLFYSGDALMTYRNLLTDAHETNVMISANAGDVTVAHGIEKWFDGWGRTHTVSILKRQLAYNLFLSDKGIARRQQETPESKADRITDEDIYPIGVTGILDRATLKIPWNMLLLRERSLSRKIYSAELDYRRIAGIGLDLAFDREHRPRELQKWRDLEDTASKALERLREGIMAIPLEKVNTQADHSRYSGYFSGDLGYDTAEKTVQRLKQKPEFRHYFETHELYGLENLDLPLDDMSKPAPLDIYSAEYRDYMNHIKFIAKLREEYKPIPRGYGWSRPDEAYVVEYANPAKLSVDTLRDLDVLEKSAKEAFSNAEAYENVVKEWIAQKRTAGAAK